MSMIDPSTDRELRRLRRQGLEFKAQLDALERRHEQETKLLRAAIDDRTVKLERIAAELDALEERFASNLEWVKTRLGLELPPRSHTPDFVKALLTPDGSENEP